MRADLSGVSNKSARHSAIEFTSRNPQGIEQPHMPAGASSYMTRGYSSGGFAVRVGSRGAGFSRFLWLAGGEGESHWQPPDPVPYCTKTPIIACMTPSEVADYTAVIGLLEILQRFGTVKRPVTMLPFPAPLEESTVPSELKMSLRT
jgi:hypothetical protein